MEAVAFGFLVPVFFVYTGVTFDLRSLLANPALFAGVAGVLVLLLVVRGLPSILAAPRGSSGRDRLAIAFFGATGQRAGDRPVPSHVPDQFGEDFFFQRVDEGVIIIEIPESGKPRFPASAVEKVRPIVAI